MTTSTQRQLRKGTTSEIAAMTPALGELVADTSRKRVVLGDGATLGGNLQTAFGTTTDLASATTTDLGSLFSHAIRITGTTTITSFGTSAATDNPFYFVRFAAALLLTHNATSLALPGAANITTAANDFALAEYLGGGNWRVLDYVYNSGQPVAVVSKAQGGTGVTASNPVIQRVSTQSGTAATGTTVLPFDDTIPQITEGDQYMSLSITPKNASNILVIEGVFGCSSSVINALTAALFQDSTTSAIAAMAVHNDTALFAITIPIFHTMTAGTTSSTTFTIRIGGTNAGTTTFNGNAGARKLGGVMSSFLQITEYAS